MQEARGRVRCNECRHALRHLTYSLPLHTRPLSRGSELSALGCRLSDQPATSHQPWISPRQQYAAPLPREWSSCRTLRSRISARRFANSCKGLVRWLIPRQCRSALQFLHSFAQCGKVSFLRFSMAFVFYHEHRKAIFSAVSVCRLTSSSAVGPALPPVDQCQKS